MTLGYIGLSISFFIVVMLFTLITIRTQIPFKWKIILVPVVVWYGLVLISIPGNFSGWAKNTEPPDGFIILGLWVDEPSTYGEGGIFFWGIHCPEKEELIKFSMNPKEFVKYVGSKAPISYRMPYNKEFHKKLLEAQKAKKLQENGILQYRRGMKPGTGTSKKKQFNDDSGFTLKSPSDLLPKVNTGESI